MDVSISSELGIDTRVIFIDSKITIRASRHERASHFPRSDKSTANTDIAKADAESATMNESTIERRYPTRTFFAARNASSVPRRASKLPFATRSALSCKEIENAA